MTIPVKRMIAFNVDELHFFKNLVLMAFWHISQMYNYIIGVDILSCAYTMCTFNQSAVNKTLQLYVTFI